MREFTGCSFVGALFMEDVKHEDEEQRWRRCDEELEVLRPCRVT